MMVGAFILATNLVQPRSTATAVAKAAATAAADRSWDPPLPPWLALAPALPFIPAAVVAGAVSAARFGPLFQPNVQ